MVKKFLINFLLILLVFASLEVISFFKIKKQNDDLKAVVDKISANNISQFETKYKILQKFSPTIYRKSFYVENTVKKPILWFGCSFAEGSGFSDENTPCSKLSKLSNSSCINRSKGATGAQFIYYQFQNNDFKKIAPEVDYVIYTFIWNHLDRLYNYQINPFFYMQNLRYKKIGGRLKEYSPFYYPIYSSFFVKNSLNKIIYRQIRKEQNDFHLFNFIMQEINKEIKNIYPNAKFIMIEFPEFTRCEMPDWEIRRLEKMGITVVRAKDFFNEIDYYDMKYWQLDEIHPQEELWDIFLPQFVEKYGL